MTKRTIKTILLVGVAATTLTACGQFGSPLDTMMGKRPKPDEFRVVTRKPLQMPGSASLPEPRLGERSPLELDPNADARELLTGKRSTPAAGGSAGESALVNAATSNTTSSISGPSLAEREAELDRNKPYEPPSVSELFSGEKDTPEDVLDPNIEAKRLRTGNAGKTPVNPLDRPPADDKDDDYVSPGEKYTPKFPYGNMKKGS